MAHSKRPEDAEPFSLGRPRVRPLPEYAPAMIPAETSAPPGAASGGQTAPGPLHFPEEAEVPEHKRHLELRTLLYLVLGTLAREHTVGSDQFVYWDLTNPSNAHSRHPLAD